MKIKILRLLGGTILCLMGCLGILLFGFGVVSLPRTFDSDYLLRALALSLLGLTLWVGAVWIGSLYR